MKNLKSRLDKCLKFSLGILTAFGMYSCSSDDPLPIIPQPNIVEVASADPNFSILVTAVESAGLVGTLSGPGPFTVFAPTNDAFNDFLQDNGLSANDLISNEMLETILLYHTVPGSVPGSSVVAGPVSTAADIPFFVSVDPDGDFWINGDTRVTQTDVAASNGLIHVVNYVITPPTQNIAEIAIDATQAGTPEFTQLVAALSRADLVGAFQEGFEDNLTVFAPTDAAFEALYEALNVQGIDDIPIETLTAVLQYHVVPARAFSQDLREGASLPTLLDGQELTVDLANLQINDSGLIPEVLNLHATNGVIHAIDQVLLPPMEGEAPVDGRITLNNSGASAYLATDIEGEGIEAELEENNPDIQLTLGGRYTFINNGGSNHPLDFRDGDGNILLAQGEQTGSFESDEAVNFVVDGNEVTFTLTETLADEIAVYRCTVHGAMNGNIIVVE